MTDACLCEHPLVGFKFGMGLRCRLCNKQLDLAAFERSRTADQKQADAQVVALQDEVLGLRSTLAEAENQIAGLVSPAPCIWIASITWDNEYWETSCGSDFTFIDGTPTDNGYKFCPNCGKPINIKEIKHEEPETDDD